MKYSDFTDVFWGCDTVFLPQPEGFARKWQPIKAMAGNTFPGAALPFGKITCSPYSGAYSAGYGRNAVSYGGKVETVSEVNRFAGFSHLHQSGTGFIGLFYNYAVTSPFYGAVATAATPRTITEESAYPGYYRCETDDGIRSECTVTKDAALHRYTFSKGNGRIAVDLSHDGLDDTLLNNPTVRGFATHSRMECLSESEAVGEVEFHGVTLYFAFFCNGSESCRLWFDQEETDSRSLQNGRTDKRFGVVFGVTTHSAELSVGITCVSAQSAREYARSAADLGFEKAAASANEQWESALGKIEVETDSPDDKTLFYSCLYQSFIKPSDWSGECPVGFDGDCMLGLATLWDQYKTLFPLVMMLFPDIRDKMMHTFLSYYKLHGSFPHSLLLSTDCNIEAKQAKALAEYIICDACYRDLDRNLAAELLETAGEDIRKLTESTARDGSFEFATHLLDIHEAGLSVCKTKAFLNPSASPEQTVLPDWRKAFDPADGLMISDSEYYEGGRWNYSFRQMHDMPERIRLAGGNKAFATLLDRFFGFSDNEPEQYFEGFNNETDMEAPFAYHDCGRRDRLCEVLDAAYRYCFRNGRGGAPGNVDSGALSSLCVWNFIGLFPVSGQNKVLIGSPKFPRTVIHLPGGKNFEILRYGNGIYTDSALLNGKELTGFELEASSIMNGGTLKITMKSCTK